MRCIGYYMNLCVYVYVRVYIYIYQCRRVCTYIYVNLDMYVHRCIGRGGRGGGKTQQGLICSKLREEVVIIYILCICILVYLDICIDT